MPIERWPFALLMVLVVAPACPRPGEPIEAGAGAARSAGEIAEAGERVPAASGLAAPELKALAFDLAHAGEFEAAREVFGRLASMEGDALAKTAWFHYGNLLETSHALDARSAGELEASLAAAREAYRRGVADMAESPAAARRQAEVNLRRVEEKLGELRAIGQGGMTPPEVSERIDDLDAPGAAAHSLEGRLRPEEPGADQYYFLWMVYRVAWLDHLYLRLGNAWKLASRGEAGLPPEGTIEERMEELGGAAGETEARGETAIERFGASPHLIDLRVLTADAHRYHAQLEMFRAARAAGAPVGEGAGGAGDGDAEGAKLEAPPEAIEQLRLAVAQQRAALELAEGAREGTAMLSAEQRAAWDAGTLERHARSLSASLESDEALLRAMTEPDGEEPGGAGAEGADEEGQADTGP